VKLPEDAPSSLPSPGGTVALRWAPIDADIQHWHLIRCAYPIGGAPQIKALLTGGLDLMTTRWELHPSVTEIVDDTGGTVGQHYYLLGETKRGDLHASRTLAVDAAATGGSLRKQKATAGWVPANRGRKDRYSNVF
jgi:hypothetical protein